MTRTNTTDEFFIDAPPKLVYDALTEPEAFREWWPGVRTGFTAGRLAVRAPGFRKLASPVSFEARLDGLRPGEGVTWWLDRGELQGRGEWWFEAFKAGTIVHYYLDVERGNRGRSRRISSSVRRHRWAIRRAMNALKDRLERRV